jgi:hypothetical protein
MIGAHPIGEAAHRHLPGIGMPQQRGNVVEKNSRLREIKVNALAFISLRTHVSWIIKTILEKQHGTFLQASHRRNT